NSSHGGPLGPAHRVTYGSRVASDILEPFDFAWAFGCQVLKVRVRVFENLRDDVNGQVKRHLGDPGFPGEGLIESSRVTSFPEQEPNGGHRWRAGAEV